jgi:DNA-binding GntR family transcriptional regulator
MMSKKDSRAGEMGAGIISESALGRGDRPAPARKITADAAASPAARRKAVPHGANSSTVYEALRQRIATSHYPPGSRLTEVDIAAEFGVSRTPVRQALHRLGADGLVEVKNGVGCRVTEIDDRQLEDMYKLRLRLVEMMGEISPQPLKPADLAAIEDIRTQTLHMLESAEEPDIGAYAGLCDQFYALVNKVIGNPFLRHFIDVMYHQTDRYWYGWMQTEDLRREVQFLLHEIEETLRALAVHDFQAVGHIRRNHISMMLARMENYRRSLAKS